MCVDIDFIFENSWTLCGCRIGISDSSQYLVRKISKSLAAVAWLWHRLTATQIVQLDGGVCQCFESNKSE